MVAQLRFSGDQRRLGHPALSCGPNDPTAFSAAVSTRTFNLMGSGTNQIDRLLPRHEAATALQLTWDVREERQGLFKREETSTPALIHDISLEGALIEVESEKLHELGDTVNVRFRGFDGRAVVRHCHPGDNGTVVFGVKFLRDETFKDAIDIAVGELRGHSAELTMAWQRQN